MTEVAVCTCAHGGRLHDEDGCRLCDCIGSPDSVEQPVVEQVQAPPVRTPSTVTPKHKCPECGKEFDSASKLGPHRGKAHGWRRVATKAVASSVPPETTAPAEIVGVLDSTNDGRYSLTLLVELGNQAGAIDMRLADANRDEFLSFLRIVQDFVTHTTQPKGTTA